MTACCARADGDSNVIRAAVAIIIAAGSAGNLVGSSRYFLGVITSDIPVVLASYYSVTVRGRKASPNQASTAI